MPKRNESIFLRDGDRCVWCLGSFDRHFLQLAHIIPNGGGGLTFCGERHEESRKAPWNMLSLCIPHHREMDQIIIRQTHILKSGNDPMVAGDATWWAEAGVPDLVADAVACAFEIYFLGHDFSSHSARRSGRKCLTKFGNTPDIRSFIASQLRWSRREDRDPVRLGLETRLPLKEAA